MHWRNGRLPVCLSLSCMSLTFRESLRSEKIALWLDEVPREERLRTSIRPYIRYYLRPNVSQCGWDGRENVTRQAPLSNVPSVRSFFAIESSISAVSELSEAS